MTIRKLLLAVIPMAALAGMVRADDTFGLADVAADTGSFEIDALSAALTGDDLTADDEVLAVDGSEATEDQGAEAVGYYGHGYRRHYGHYGHSNYGHGCYRHCYRPVYQPICYQPVYQPVVYQVYRPVVYQPVVHTYYQHYCW